MVQRDSGGRIAIGAPVNDDHATTKKYVDEMTVAWSRLTGVPSYSPSNHTHAYSAITGKPTTFAPVRSTSTVEGGLKSRISGTTLYMTNNGNNA